MQTPEDKDAEIAKREEITINAITVLDQYVLVKQVMKKKKSVIILDKARDSKEIFDYSFKVVQIGKKCERDIKVGDTPIFSQHVSFMGLKVLEKDENDGMTSLIIVHEGDIIAIDNEPTVLSAENSVLDSKN